MSFVVPPTDLSTEISVPALKKHAETLHISFWGMEKLELLTAVNEKYKSLRGTVAETRVAPHDENNNAETRLETRLETRSAFDTERADDSEVDEDPSDVKTSDGTVVVSRDKFKMMLQKQQQQEKLVQKQQEQIENLEGFKLRQTDVNVALKRQVDTTGELAAHNAKQNKKLDKETKRLSKEQEMLAERHEKTAQATRETAQLQKETVQLIGRIMPTRAPPAQFTVQRQKTKKREREDAQINAAFQDPDFVNFQQKYRKTFRGNKLGFVAHMAAHGVSVNNADRYDLGIFRAWKKGVTAP